MVSLMKNKLTYKLLKFFLNFILINLFEILFYHFIHLLKKRKRSSYKSIFPYFSVAFIHFSGVNLISAKGHEKEAVMWGGMHPRMY